MTNVAMILTCCVKLFPFVCWYTVVTAVYNDFYHLLLAKKSKGYPFLVFQEESFCHIARGADQNTSQDNAAGSIKHDADE